MLFRTVYGPELEAIYAYIANCQRQGVKLQKSDIRTAFMSTSVEGKFGSTQSVDDALTFLKSAQLIDDKQGYQVCEEHLSTPFALQVLTQLREFECGRSTAEHPLDPLYTLLLTEVFVKPDRLFTTDMHAAANELHAVQAAGGLSQEKVRAWERVMEFLGIGRRIAGGFQCTYTPTLISTILTHHNIQNDTLQSFLEDKLVQILPYARADGELAQAVHLPLAYLHSIKRVTLFTMQDSPTRAYFGDKRYKGMRWEGNHV